MLARSLRSSSNLTAAAARTTGTSPATRRLALIAGHSTLRPSTQTRTMAASTYSGTSLKLNTGATIPALGFGTWQDKDAQEDAVSEAIKAGYRHIDTARIYGTEPAVARGIKAAGVPRSELFITTKLWNHKHKPEDVEAALDDSLRDLETDYVDLYLMHWPAAFAPGDESFPKDSEGNNKKADIDYLHTYQAMEKLVASGKARAIGVSNFAQAEVQRIIDEAKIVPAAHQLEMHPYLQQASFAEFHRKHGIIITQYSPFGNQNEIYDGGKHMNKLIDDPVLVEIGKKHGKSGAQTALAWGIGLGHSVIPKSKTPSRIRDNFGGDFKLSQSEIEEISKIDKKLRFNDPSKSFGYKFFSDLDGKQ